MNGEKWIIDSSGQWGISAHGGSGSSGTTANEISLPQNTSNPYDCSCLSSGTLILGAMIVLLVFIGLYAIKGNKHRVQQYGNYTQLSNGPVDKQCNLSALTTEAALIQNN